MTRYYSRAVTITDPSELAGAMTDKLVELFEEKHEVSQTRLARQEPGARRALNPSTEGDTVRVHTAIINAIG